MTEALARRFRPENLQLFIFGPGTGESVVVRVPPDHWLVIDSCVGTANQANLCPAVELLSAADARAEIVILTHPHTDHAAGLDQIINHHSIGLIGAVEHFVEPRPPTANNGRWQAIAATRPALAAIRMQWRQEESRRWKLSAGDQRPIGDARLTVLSPDPEAVARFAADDGDLNRLSSPFTLDWGDCRIVLGADLPARDWPGTQPHSPWPLNQHHALKVAHHGSLESQYQPLLEPDDGRARWWAITPWKGGRHLPRFEDQQGAAFLLERNGELFVTSLIQSHNLGTRPRASRSQVASGVGRVRLANDIVASSTSTKRVDQSWVAAAFDRAGNIVDCDLGEDAMTVVP